MSNNIDKYIQLNKQLAEVVKQSLELNIPLVIAIEKGAKIETFCNGVSFFSEKFHNIRMLHDKKGDLPNFLLALSQIEPEPMELNNVKSQANEYAFTLTNQQVITTKH